MCVCGLGGERIVKHRRQAAVGPNRVETIYADIFTDSQTFLYKPT